MSKRFIPDEDRALLLAAYKADKKVDAPANISDKTLLLNYGNAEQKALAESIPANSAPHTGAKDANAAAPSNTASGTTTGEQQPQSNPTAEAAKEARNTPEYIEAVNRYAKANDGKLPAPNLTIEAIDNALAAQEAEAKAAKAAAKKSVKVEEPNTDLIELTNTKTDETITVSKHTYERFIKKSQPEFVPSAKVPVEVENLKNK